MSGKQLIDVFCNMFPNLKTDIDSYMDGGKDVVIIKRKSLKPHGVYIFTYRNSSDWELLCVKGRK